MIVVDLIREVVKRVSDNLTPQLQALDSRITGVHYLHGHPIEILETLAQKDKSNKFRFDKYPLIALFEDIEENNAGNYLNSSGGLNIIIARATRPEYKADVRREKNFKPFLYPLFENFMQEYKRMEGLSLLPAHISYRKIDRLYWGRSGLYRNSANIGNDFIDAIEIQNLSFRTSEACQIKF